MERNSSRPIDALSRARQRNSEVPPHSEHAAIYLLKSDQKLLNGEKPKRHQGMQNQRTFDLITLLILLSSPKGKKMALSNNVIGAINFVAMLLSIPIIGAGIWLANQPDNSCVKILQWPVIILGVLILVVALAGFIGGFWRIPWLLIAYLVGMLILIVLLACLVVFIYMVTMRGSGHLEPSRAYLEYHLEDFSGWLQRRVRSSFKWERIKLCLSSTDMCSQMNQSYTMAIDFFSSHLTPIESGCCKPPTACGYTFVNPTNWISPINNIADPDCIQWSNDQMQLCYDCNSCKAGLLANIKEEWRKADIILLITLIALISVYLENVKSGSKSPEIPVLEFENKMADSDTDTWPEKTSPYDLQT
ncbi:hypothetical protein V6N13_015023 [Hibiscus sabdariffa]